MKKSKPVKDVRFDLQFFIRFLTKTGKGSLAAKGELPAREELEQAVQTLPPCARSLIGIIERSGVPDHAREVALHNLWSALASAYTIGSEGTRSRNARAVGTATARKKAKLKREPSDKQMREAIREAEKKYPSGRGRSTAINFDVAHKMKVSEKTVRRHRKKMRTA
jgi:hypothetical protein